MWFVTECRESPEVSYLLTHFNVGIPDSMGNIKQYGIPALVIYIEHIRWNNY